LGSASLDLIKNSSESLAGRIRLLEIAPFGIDEIKLTDIMKLWLRGGYPVSFLATTDELSSEWREQYIRTFLERDIPQLGINIPSAAMRRFWMMLTHFHGQVINYSEMARSLDISDATARRYLDILAGTFMVRRLQPWFENIGKRQVKQPKIYFRDSGILHHLMGIALHEQLQVHPRLGASWEGFAMEQIIQTYRLREGDAFFWAIHQQAELDLLFHKNGKKLGFEFKYTDKPTITKSVRTAMEILQLDMIYIVYPGSINFPLSDRIQALGLNDVKNSKR